MQQANLFNLKPYLKSPIDPELDALANRLLTIRVDCNDPNTGKYQKNITSFEVSDGEEQLFTLWDDRAGFYNDLTKVKFKANSVHFWEGTPGVSVPFTTRVSQDDAPCWEAITVRAKQVLTLLNWFARNGNFGWESGAAELEAHWEECVSGKSFFEKKHLPLLFGK